MSNKKSDQRRPPIGSPSRTPSGVPGGSGAGKIQPPFGAEQTLRDLKKVLRNKNFGSMEEMNSFLTTLTGNGLQKAVAPAPAPTAKEQAQELAWQELEAPSAAKARKLAQLALLKDADCVDALTLLTGLDSKTAQELVEGLQRAVLAGERSLGEAFFQKNKGHFWGLLETRPYMRARQELADTLRQMGRYKDAIGQFEAMLELNPNDNQGIREPLLALYLQIGDLDAAGRLLQQNEDDGSATFAWARVLERILAAEMEEAARLLKNARKENLFVEQYLTTQRELPDEMPDAYTMGSEEEAMITVESLTAAWAAHPKALLWLLGEILEQRAPTPPKRGGGKVQSIRRVN